MNYLGLALEESVFSIGVSRPNPAVGAVVVKDGIVVGKGRTQRPGSAHAEVMALRDAGELARGAAIYVTLEPCCHYGRTPPCTKAIIDAGIKKVFFAHADPNPVVRGNSRRILEEAGIEVYEGVKACIAAAVEEGWDDGYGVGGECHCLQMSKSDCNALGNSSSKNGIASCDFDIQRKVSLEAEGRYVFYDIERYFEAYDYFVRNKRTFVEVKCAVSQEGYMGVVCADGRRAPLKITGENANCWNHELRSISDAVLVGAGTLLADNPSLNVRLVAGNDPVKIIWAGHHEFTADEVRNLKVFAKARSLFEGEVSGDGTARILVFSCVSQPALCLNETANGCADGVKASPHSGQKSAQCHSEQMPAQCPLEQTTTQCHSEEILAQSLPEQKSALCHPRESEDLAVPCEVVLLSGNSFAENWTQMVDELSRRGMHRLMVEPGEGLAKQLFENGGWNRLDLWRSTDCRVDDAVAAGITSYIFKDGVFFPELPNNIVAKESFMAGSDVLTVYYPA